MNPLKNIIRMQAYGKPSPFCPQTALQTFVQKHLVIWKGNINLYLIVMCIIQIPVLFKRSWNEAVPSSSYSENNFGYSNIKRAVKRIYPDAIIAPNLMLANTDTKHYYAANLTSSIYR